jgi:ribosomal protein S12 methylthiotransferase accessory factor
VIHAIYEVIERDILSFEYIQENALLVPVLTLPQSAQNLIARITNEGLELVVKTVVNPYEIPFFKAYIIDKWAANPTLLNAGYGCHGNAQIALMRALAEAAQSRMSYIHGGREDLTKGYQSFSDQKEDLSQKFNDLYASIQHAKGEIHFNTIQSLPFSTESTRSYLDQLITHFQKAGIIREIYIGRHTQNHDSLQVVKAIIPDMEFYNNETNRIGPRLLHFIQNLTL